MSRAHGLPLLAAVAWLATSPFVSRAADLSEPDAPIQHVTVFEDRALVERAFELTVAAGQTRIAVEGLERSADPASVRIDAGEGCRATSFSLMRDEQPVPLDAGASARARELEREADLRMRSILALEEKRAALDQAATLLRRYGAHGQAALSQRATGLEPVRDATWRAALDFAPDQELALGDARRDLDRRLEELHEQHGRIVGNLYQIERDGVARRGATLSFDLTCAERERVPVALTYLVANAFWRPTYEVITGRDGEHELVYRAHIAQRTGVDWAQVRMTLSTSRPALGNVVPELAPMEARTVAIEAPEKRLLSSVEQTVVHDAKQGKLESRITFVANREPAPRTPGPVVAFALPEPLSVTADGSPRVVTTARAVLPGTAGLYASPALGRAAYVRIETTNPFDQALLPGRLTILGGAGTAAQARIEATASHAPLELFLGADERVRVLRRSLVRPKTESTFFTGRKRVAFHYEIDVANHGEEDAKVTVVDRMPVAELDEVEVHLEESEELRAPARVSEDGILEWDLVVAAGATERFSFGYRVEMPERFDWQPPKN